MNPKVEKLTKAEQYAEARRRIETTLVEERRAITIMASVTAILKEAFPHFYWVGFLIVEEREMVVGPFQGPLACLRLPLNSSGVCGTCYRTAKTVLVPDVAGFQGRVGCDAVSKSEIAVPILVNGRVMALLDIDCTELAGVDEVDQQELTYVLLRFLFTLTQQNDKCSDCHISCAQ
jgi:L-methionine (R)-S-oxide reductase